VVVRAPAVKCAHPRPRSRRRPCRAPAGPPSARQQQTVTGRYRSSAWRAVAPTGLV